MKILQSRSFERKVKKFGKQEKKALDKQILKIASSIFSPHPNEELTSGGKRAKTLQKAQNDINCKFRQNALAIAV